MLWKSLEEEEFIAAIYREFGLGHAWLHSMVTGVNTSTVVIHFMSYESPPCQW